VAGCDRGGGALSALGGGLCDLTGPAGGPVDDLLDPLTDTVDDLGEKTDQVLDDVGDKTNQVLDDVGDAAKDVLGGKPSNQPEPPAGQRQSSGPPSTAPGDDAGPESHADQDADAVPRVDTGCLPLLTSGCDEVTTTQAPAPRERRDRSTPAPATPGATPSGEHEAPPSAAPEGTPAPWSVGGDGDGLKLERANPVDLPPRAADIDAPPPVPLWPGQPLPELTEPLAARRVVPSRTDDAVGTVLTAILLGSAIFAARIVHTRKARRGEADTTATMPLQGLHRPDTGRHRLA
jgi:hypothetical protein